MIPRLWGVPPPTSADDPARGIATVRDLAAVELEVERIERFHSVEFTGEVAGFENDVGLGHGSGRKRTASAKLKIAAFAPIASARVTTATAVKPGDRRSFRTANLRSSSNWHLAPG